MKIAHKKASMVGENRLKTGAESKASLDDGRLLWVNGKKID